MPTEFVRFVAAHYPLVSSICRLSGGFRSDDEIAAFLRSHLDVSIVGGKINEMKRLGVLTQSTGEWAPPPFLTRFIAALDDRHTLATPAVVLAWVENLDGLTVELANHLDQCAKDGCDVDEERAGALLHEIGDAIGIVGTTVAENIARISMEVAQYRATEDSAKLRSRLQRLVMLYDRYLMPIMGILEIGGRFRAVTEHVINLSARMTSGSELVPPRLMDDAQHLRQHVTFLRRIILVQADEANAESAPLCAVALRESLIARGVNRALEAKEALLIDQIKVLELVRTLGGNPVIASLLDMWDRHHRGLEQELLLALS